MSQQHNHLVGGFLKPFGECPACDEQRFKPTITSKPGEHLTIDIEVADDAGPDELAAAMEAAAREAGLL